MGALDGIKVLEAGLLVQGPQAALMLSDWGADVVKVEMPNFGDQSRWLPAIEGDSRSAYFAGCNRGKRSLTLDLRQPGGRDLFLQLAEQADVVISNFKPGTMDAWGLGYEVVAARNPRIVYATGSTFGTLGPDAAREGADLSAQSAGGLISTTGKDGHEYTPVAATITDHIASLNLVGGIMAALFARERNGRGQRVDASLIGGQIWAQASEYTRYLLTGQIGGRSNRGHPMIPGIYGIFPTSDGWIALVGIVGPARTKFFEVIGRPELAEQFPQMLYWDDIKHQLFPLIDEALKEKTTAEWSDVFRAAELRFAPVRNHADVVADPSTWENGYFAKVDTDDGEVSVVATPVRFSDTPAEAKAVVPELGQHTEEVLLDYGFDWDDIERFREAGTI